MPRGSSSVRPLPDHPEVPSGDVRLPLRRVGKWLDVRALTPDPVTLAVLALLVLAWCIEGALEATALPHRLDVAVDVSELLLCACLFVRLVRARSVPRVPVLVWAYLIWIIVGLHTHAPGGAVATSVRNFVLLPMLALLLALGGTSERRARLIVATLVALGFLEFVLMAIEALRSENVDEIAGSFGKSANAATAAATLFVVCVAASGYLVRAPGEKLALTVVAVLPLFSAWAVVKIVPLLMPVAALAIVVPALAVRQTSWRRALTTMTAIAVSVGLVIAWYAAFRQDSFRALFNSSARANYVRNASINRTSATAAAVPEGRPRRPFVNLVDDPSAEIDTAGMSSYANAAITHGAVAYAGRGSFRIGDSTAGEYTAQVTNYNGTRISIKKHATYTFSAYVRGATEARRQTVAVQIEWRDAKERILATTLGVSTVAPRHYRRFVATGTAPTRAVSATPKIAVTHVRSADSAIYADALQFRRGKRPIPYVERPENRRRRALFVRGPFPGRLTQWRMADREISTSSARRLFGEGLGSATVAENLGVAPEDLSPNAEAASYSDFGTLLVERGWTGVAAIALVAFILGLTALRIARRLPGRLWTTAFTLAIPGVLCVMAAYGMIADQLRNAAAALTFWVVIALGLSPGTFLGRVRDDRATSSGSTATGAYERNGDRLRVTRRKTN